MYNRQVPGMNGRKFKIIAFMVKAYFFWSDIIYGNHLDTTIILHDVDMTLQEHLQFSSLAAL